jgi:plastocyanin
MVSEDYRVMPESRMTEMEDAYSEVVATPDLVSPAAARAGLFRRIAGRPGRRRRRRGQRRRRRGGSDSNGSGSGGPVVAIRDFAFTPVVDTAAAGTTVTWINYDDVTHTSTGDDGSGDGQVAPNGGTFSHNFSLRGTYGYHCDIHTYMAGTIVVR